ncbi:MAG: NAD-binding protein [Proteobacteria bacterium]|nr:NAD-binding protein [Pseudomonadota bacterium]
MPDRDTFSLPRINWRWLAAVALFGSAFVGLLSGVSLSERPDVGEASLLTKAYYSLGLFVMGGMDLGVPVGGPGLGRAAMWIGYFGCPLLMASAVIEAVLRAISPERWQLRRLHNHVVVVGSDELTTSYLRVLRTHQPATPVVVVDAHIEPARQRELEATFDVTVLVGDITLDYVQKHLSLSRTVKVVMLGAEDFESYEAASEMLRAHPQLASRIVLHCHNLRFMRAMAQTRVAQRCVTFNSYHLAAAGLVEHQLIGHFHRTKGRDVVMAGFGRFGQTVLEELEDHAMKEIHTVVVIDIDADRRIQVADEQARLGDHYKRVILQGDISHPEVWRKLSATVDLNQGEPTLILGTGRAEDNLRTALWLKQRHPNAAIYARTNQVSELALEVGEEHGINCFSIRALVEANLPIQWL